MHILRHNFIKTLGILAVSTVFSIQFGNTASANPDLCAYLSSKGKLWIPRDNTSNAGGEGVIRLYGGCDVGTTGRAKIMWNQERFHRAYEVGSHRLRLGDKWLRARENEDGTWTVLNYSSPL